MQDEKSTDTVRRIRELEERIAEKLKPDLERAVEQRRAVKADLQDYADLERNLQLLQQQVPSQHLFATFALLFKFCSCFCCCTSDQSSSHKKTLCFW